MQATTPVADEVDLEQDPWVRTPITVGATPAFETSLSSYIDILDTISVRADAVAARTEMWKDRNDAGDDDDDDNNDPNANLIEVLQYDTDLSAPEKSDNNPNAKYIEVMDLSQEKSDKDTNMGGGQ